MQAPQNYLNTVATEESRKQKLFELEVRLHNQEVYNKDTVQVDLNRLIDGWNAMEARLDALESVGEEAPTAGGRRTRRKRTRKKRRKKKTKKRRRRKRKKTKKRRR